MSIEKHLLYYYSRGLYPMHMPGHKRNPEFGWAINPYQIDVTEVPGVDNLHKPDGIILEAMNRCARLYGVRRAFFLINGSSGGLMSAIHAAVPQRGSVLMTRICHRSIYNGLRLREAEMNFILPDRDPSYNITLSISPETVEEGLAAHPEVNLVIITSPTYEGVISDISGIAEVCHRRGIPLLVDGAHGAHLPFMETEAHERGSGKDCGYDRPDMVVVSLHKTLPSPTQTSALLFNSSIISEEAMQEALSIFQTTSPSYILMAGIDNCMEFLDSEGRPAAFQKYSRLLEGFSEKTRDLRRLRVFCQGSDSPDKHKGIFGFDRGKIIVSAVDSGTTGFELDGILLNKYKLQIEAPFKDYIIAMTSVCDTADGLERFADALVEIDESLAEAGKSPETVQP